MSHEQYQSSQRPAHLRAHAPRPTQQREPRDNDDDLLDDEQEYEPRMPTSTRRYRPTTTRDQQGNTRAVRRQGSRDVIVYHGEYEYDPPTRSRAPIPSSSGREGMHPLFYVGMTLFLLMLGYLGLTLLGHWWQVLQDDQHYGRPRTYQTDAVVGQNHDSANMPSHFIALNLHRHILVIELPAGDAQHAKVYVGPILLGDGQDVAVVTLSFADVNGDGKPDMLIHVDQTQIVFLNDGESFRPQRPGEQISQPTG